MENKKVFIKNKSELLTTVFWLVIMMMVGSYLSGCSIHAGIDWQGKTEINKVTKSPPTLDKHVWW